MVAAKMGSKSEAIGLKIGMDLAIISADGEALSVFDRARAKRSKRPFYAFFGPSLYFRAMKHKIYYIKHYILDIY